MCIERFILPTEPHLKTPSPRYFCKASLRGEAIRKIFSEAGPPGRRWPVHLHVQRRRAAGASAIPHRYTHLHLHRRRAAGGPIGERRRADLCLGPGLNDAGTAYAARPSQKPHESRRFAHRRKTRPCRPFNQTPIQICQVPELPEAAKQELSEGNLAPALSLEILRPTRR